MTAAPCTDFAHQLAALRPMLVHLARRQLRNEAWVEDAVSETLVAALEKPESFAGRAQARTWVVGILKHKMVDQVRRHTRECPFERHDDDETGPDRLPGGADCDEPARWGDPLATLARRQFVAEVDAALAALPPQQGRAFVMREWMDHDTDEVARELGVTRNHLGVMLHRARARLRESIGAHWQGAAPLLA